MRKKDMHLAFTKAHMRIINDLIVRQAEISKRIDEAIAEKRQVDYKAIADALQPILRLNQVIKAAAPIPIILHCPMCKHRHIDSGILATKPHHTHACQECGFVWRPAIVATVGVQFLPGFKDEQ